jgi:lipoate-protein ligase B
MYKLYDIDAGNVQTLRRDPSPPGEPCGVLRVGRQIGTTRLMVPLRVIDLGAAVPYTDGQQAMRAAIAHIDDLVVGGPALVLVEHQPTITITRRGGISAFVSPAEVIARDGICVVEADRGGDVTFHGPGQLTGYPILRLGPTSLGCDVVAYVRAMEQAIVDVCVDLGVDSAHTVSGTDASGHVLTGVWVNEPVVADETLGCHFRPIETRAAKVCAIGVGLGGGVTRHGFALNVTTELERFTRHIIPCGLTARGVTSLDRVLPRPPPMDVVKSRVIAAVHARLAPFHRSLPA